ASVSRLHCWADRTRPQTARDPGYSGGTASVHDLSRVQMDRTPPPTPRFNMPFELGLAVSWAKRNPRRHTWFVFESQNRRALKSISDLNGTDVNIHDGTIEGVMR